jgi:peroxiredoxin
MKTFLSIVLAGSLAVGMSTFAFAQDGGKDGGKNGAKDGGKQRANDKASGAKVGEAAPSFTLKTADGKDWSLSDAAGKVVVIEWVNPECPVCVRVMEDGTVAGTIKGVKEQFPDAVYLAINSSAARPSSFDATPGYLTKNKIDIPALFDRDGAVGKQYGARTTPHCFVIDAKGVLVYKGAIDNSQGGDGKTNYVVQAVTQLKKGEKVTPGETKPFGCSVKY